MVPGTTDNAILSRANLLIASCSVMTLATSSEAGPWAAPVYYAGIRDRFYFFSSPDARHVQDALAHGRAAAAIYAAGRSWRDLQGLQMSGKIERIPHPAETARALIAYVKKFPLVKTFFGGAAIPDPADFVRRFHASLYRFQPDHIVFMDNAVDFGFRREIPKDALT